jgi:hypothetical protein
MGPKQIVWRIPMENDIIWSFGIRDWCYAPLHEEAPKHHGHKGDPRVIPGTCGAIGKRAQVILVWVSAPSIGNAS